MLHPDCGCDVSFWKEAIPDIMLLFQEQSSLGVALVIPPSYLMHIL